MQTVYNIIFLFLCTNLFSQIPKDKILHLYSGAFISSWCYATKQDNHPVIYGLSGGLIAGVAKESYDKLNGNKFDVNDIKFTLIGSLTSVVIIETIRKIKNKKSRKCHG